MGVEPRRRIATCMHHTVPWQLPCTGSHNTASSPATSFSHMTFVPECAHTLSKASHSTISLPLFASMLDAKRGLPGPRALCRLRSAVQTIRISALAASFSVGQRVRKSTAETATACGMTCTTMRRLDDRAQCQLQLGTSRRVWTRWRLLLPPPPESGSVCVLAPLTWEQGQARQPKTPPCSAHNLIQPAAAHWIHAPVLSSCSRIQHGGLAYWAPDIALRADCTRVTWPPCHVCVWRCTCKRQ